MVQRQPVRAMLKKQRLYQKEEVAVKTVINDKRGEALIDREAILARIKENKPTVINISGGARGTEYST